MMSGWNHKVHSIPIDPAFDHPHLADIWDAKNFEYRPIARSGKDLVGFGNLFNLSLIDDGQALAGGQCIVEAVCDIDHHQSCLLLNCHQFVVELFTDRAIESGERFVQQQDFRIGGKCPCDRDSLLLATAQFVWVSIGECIKVQAVKQFV